MATSSAASLTSTVPRVAPSTPPAPRAALLSMTPPTPPTTSTLQHYLLHPRATWEPPAPPLHQQLPPVKAVQVAPPVNPHLMTTWVKRGFRLPADKLMLSATSSSPLSPVPTSIRAALTDPSWRHAIEAEYDDLITNNTWDLVPRPVGSNIITVKWIFKHKFNSDGTLKWYKAH
jgi:hypothetical protein